MKKIKIGLVEIGDSFGEQYYLPYSIGILRAYAERFISSSGNYEFLPIIYRRGNINKYAESLFSADIVFYSTYLWNFKISLNLAQRVKTIKPTIINVFGGPQVPESADKLCAFLKMYSCVDIASFGQGERPFLRILERCQDRIWDDVPAIGYLNIDNNISVNEFRETLSDINEIPSPYLSGVFDELLEQNPKELWQGRIETNRGCPFTCAYCYWGKKSERKLKQFDLDRIYLEIDWLSKNKVEFVFCCDANFGILKRDLEIATKVAGNKKKLDYPKAFSVQNTKNSTDRIFKLQKILFDAGLQKGVNLALQSLNEETLKYIERSNIDNKTYAELQKLFTRNNIATFTDLIIGLPGETYDTFTEGVSEIIANGQHNRIQFINLTILENTLMAEPEYQQKYGFSIIETDLIPHHSSLDMIDNIVETQRLVTATQSMPSRDWMKTRVFSWMTSLLHFNKLLQIPFIVLHEACGISYKALIEAFIKKVDGQDILTEIVSVLEKKAVNIQSGGSEYSLSKDWLNIVWYPDELLLINMSTEDRINGFYFEAEERLISLAKDYPEFIEPDVIADAVRLNRALLKQPFLSEDISIKCHYNIWEIYQAALRGEHDSLKNNVFEYKIDRTSQQWTCWEDWCREVIWFGNKRGDYIYSAKRSV